VKEVLGYLMFADDGFRPSEKISEFLGFWSDSCVSLCFTLVRPCVTSLGWRCTYNRVDIILRSDRSLVAFRYRPSRLFRGLRPATIHPGTNRHPPWRWSVYWTLHGSLIFRNGAGELATRDYSPAYEEKMSVPHAIIKPSNTRFEASHANARAMA